MKNSLLIGLILLFFTTCKITTHVHFNKDNSGTVKIIYDYSQYLSETGGKDSTGFLDSMSESLKKLDTLGIMRNFKVNKTEFGIEVSYGFSNPDQLNSTFNKFMDGDDEMEKTAGKFTPARKKMKYELINPVKKTEKEEVVNSTDLDGLFEWEFKVSFEREIKKCSNENYAIHEDRHSISLKGGLSKFQDPEMMNFTVKLK